MDIKFDFNRTILDKWESYFGAPYANWTEEQKTEFLMSLVKGQVSTLDQYVGSLSMNPFETTIANLKDLNFEVVYRGEFIYPNTMIPAQDVVMCNKETGMIYYATSYQDGYNISDRTDVKESCLYFQASEINPGATYDTLQVLQNSSGIKYNDGSSYHSCRNIKPEEISLLLGSCQFETRWRTNEFVSIVNEGDCFNPTGEFAGLDFQEIQNRKIAEMPKEVQQIMGFDYNKTI